LLERRCNGNRSERLTNRRRGSFRRLLLVFFFHFLFLVVLVDEVGLFALFFLIIFFVVVIVVSFFGDEIEMDGMGLRDFELGFALGAAEDFAFLDFVLIDVDFCGTFGAANHGNILRKMVGPTRTGKHASMTSVLYTGCVKSTAMRRECADR
jgi:hypothetical protein